MTASRCKASSHVAASGCESAMSRLHPLEAASFCEAASTLEAASFNETASSYKATSYCEAVRIILVNFSSSLF